MKFKIIKINKKSVRGFILPLTLLVCSIILVVASGISAILSKELYFSKISRESQIAYYAADDAMICAIMVDNKYVDPATGSGIFPHDSDPTADPTNSMQQVLNKVNLNRQYRGLNSLSLNDIKCATVAIFDTSPSGANFTSVVSPVPRVNSGGESETEWISTYSMRMDLGDGTYRCAKVKVSKTNKYRQIIARGFTSCDAGAHPIERAIVNTTELK